MRINPEVVFNKPETTRPPPSKKKKNRLRVDCKTEIVRSRVNGLNKKQTQCFFSLSLFFKIFFYIISLLSPGNSPGTTQ